MLYNVNTTAVRFFVNDTNAIEAVDSVLRSLILEWTTSGSPVFTREYVAPFSVEDMAPHCISKYQSIQITHLEKKLKFQYINPKGKFILSPQEQRQGPRFSSHLKDYHQKLT